VAPILLMMPRLTIIKDGTKHTLEVEEGQSILEAALAQGIEIEHACGGFGFCTTCLCHVKDNPQNLADITPEELNMGIPENSTDMRLSCQARMKGDVTVETEY